MSHKSVYKLKHILLIIYLQLCHNMLTVIQYYIIVKIKKTKTSRKDLKKEGIMRINSYNKFFAEVAKIMNTSVKDVKPIDGRYKVELANHVYLNVYRGVGGSLFIHDHRGVAHITSCYDFEDFKTMKDLYERLVSDYSESAKKEVMEVKQELNSSFGKEQYFDTDSVQPNKTIIAKIEDINYCPNQNTCCVVSPFVHCNYNYKSEACIKAHKNFIHDCEQLHKQMKARSNPEWHHVSLATLANIDIDMLDETRQIYMRVRYQLNRVIKAIYKCNRYEKMDILRTSIIQHIKNLLRNKKANRSLLRYAEAQIDNCYLVNGVISSKYAGSYSEKSSRAYKKYFCL